jgi:hypothetical protein
LLARQRCPGRIVEHPRTGHGDGGRGCWWSAAIILIPVRPEREREHTRSLGGIDGDLGAPVAVNGKVDGGCVPDEAVIMEALNAMMLFIIVEHNRKLYEVRTADRSKDGLAC